MKKIFVVVEGPTEERFVHKVLQPHFLLQNIFIEAQQWITNRKLGTKGGGSNYDVIENHIKRLMSKYCYDKDVFISIMVDLYTFPKNGNSIFDDDVNKLQTAKEKVQLLMMKMEQRFSYKNFIPYIQLHEFEALLLSEPNKLESFYPDKKIEIVKLVKEISGMKPEEVNETPHGAPSKRIIKYIPTYKKQKTTAGVNTAIEIGLHKIRTKCSNFNEWITKLEGINS